MNSLTIFLAWFVLVFIKVIVNVIDVINSEMTIKKLLIVDIKPLSLSFFLTALLYITPIFLAYLYSLGFS